jgi:hypothetical protein
MTPCAAMVGLPAVCCRVPAHSLQSLIAPWSPNNSSPFNSIPVDVISELLHVAGVRFDRGATLIIAYVNLPLIHLSLLIQ